jgi:hypothetical protein
MHWPIEIPLFLKIALATILCVGVGFVADRQTSLTFCNSLGMAIDPNNGHLVDCPLRLEEPVNTNLIIPGELPNGKETPEKTATALFT